MSTTTDLVEQAIAKEEQEALNSEQDNDKKTEDVSTSKPESGKDTKSTGNTGDTKPEPDKAAGTNDATKEEEGYTAEDALEVEEEAAPAKPAETPTKTGATILNEAERDHLRKELGEPLVLQGFKIDAEGNRTPYEVKAYAPQNLPNDFNFNSDAERTAAAAAFNRLDQNAEKIIGQYRADQLQKQSDEAGRDFQERENRGIQDDVTDLQKEGRFPKFKVQPGAKGFDDTPEAKQMAEVLEIMSERNDMYMKQYNQGRPYKHIGFAEAYDIYERTNPDRVAAKKEDEAQAQEDKERKAVAERSSTNRGATTGNIMKPTVRSGTTTRDILARIEAEE
jgi:hypothetical protein